MAEGQEAHGLNRLLSLFFLSGAAGLVYETSWTRQVGLLFGQTIYAASIVLACFFAGMAVGLWLAGKPSARSRPLLAYAVAEGVVAVWAFLVPLILRLAEFPAAAEALNGASPAAQAIARAGFAFAALLPATVAMGATLPFMATAVDRVAGLQGVSRCYAANILGAVAGIALATFVMIEAFGVRGSSYAAAGVSALCAAGALYLDRLIFSASFDRRDGAKGAPGKLDPWLAVASFSGFGLLALQVLYIRLFSLVFHNSVYSFGVVVGIFLIALAGGAFLASRVSQRADPELALSRSWRLGGMAVMISVLAVLCITKLAYFSAGPGFIGYLIGATALAAVTMLIPVGLLGLALPLAWTAAQRHRSDMGETVAALATANTIAAAVGAVVASFVLLPTLGLWGSFAILASGYVFLGPLIFRSQRLRVDWVVSGAAGAVCIGAWLIARSYTGLPPGESLVQRSESAYGWTDVVRQLQGGLSLRQNVHYSLGGTGAIGMERRQGQLPILLHPEPQDVLFIGLATGITAGAVLNDADVKSIQVVELIPDVAQAAHHFAEANGGITHHPKARIVINDGRHFLQEQGKDFDVIVADLFVPWESRTGYLYTVEHYAAAKRRLKSGGIFCQWLPSWQLGEREFRLIADSFASVFPTVTLWTARLDAYWTVLGLVGSEKPLNLDGGRLARRLVQRGADSWPRTPGDLMANYIGDWSRHGDAELNTDEYPRVEFSAPVTGWTKDRRLTYKTLVSFHEQVLSRLPSEGVRYSPAGIEVAPTMPAIRSRQRELLLDQTR